MWSAPRGHVMIKLGTIETFNAIHVSLLSLSVVCGLICLCEQVITFILEKKMSRERERESKEKRHTNVSSPKLGPP